MQNKLINAEIITIGTEITTGNIFNSNANYLAKELLNLGINCFYHISVDDNEDRIYSAIETALSRSDLIITTGGLGPTKDDITKEVCSKVLGLDLIMDNEMKSKIESYFKTRNKPMTKNNLRQSLRPVGSSFLNNSIGTAPGIIIENDCKKIILLPGPPRELSLMFEENVKPLLNMGGTILNKSIHLIGIGESSLETELLSMNLATNNSSITTFAKNHTLEIRIISKGYNRESLETESNDIIEKIKSKFYKYIYSYENPNLEEVVIKLLQDSNFTIGICESCTGGLLSSKLTSIAGASLVFDRGLVTYSNQSKVDELMVNLNTLDKYGAVSKEVAYEMAKGLIEKTNIDLAVSITGIAGPDGGSKEKPVGLVYICLMGIKGHVILEEHFSGDRKSIQNATSIVALKEIRKYLLK